MKDQVIDLATTLIETDRKVVKAVVNSDFENLPSYIYLFRTTKIELQRCLSHMGVVENVDDAEKDILTKAQSNFPTDSVIDQIDNKISDDISFRDLTEEEISTLGSELLYSWISHYEYVQNIFKVNILIFRSTVAPKLRGYISETRNCFALEQFNATISMCRTILEAGAKDICEKQGLFEPHDDKVIEINPEVFNHLIKSISKGHLKKRATKLYYRDACPVVHGDRLVTSDEALRVLTETIDVIQELYSVNGL